MLHSRASWSVQQLISQVYEQEQLETLMRDALRSALGRVGRASVTMHELT
jgi:hypothetical protein